MGGEINSVMIKKKYSNVKSPPDIMYGGSTGLFPIHVNKTMVLNNAHVLSWWYKFKGEFIGASGKKNRIRIAENITTTPPTLLGIDRKIAYAHKKYHSGLICVGVERGLALIKFSGSFRVFGDNKDINKSIRVIRMNPFKSFEEKKGWNGILL